MFHVFAAVAQNRPPLACTNGAKGYEEEGADPAFASEGCEVGPLQRPPVGGNEGQSKTTARRTGEASEGGEAKLRGGCEIRTPLFSGGGVGGGGGVVIDFGET